MHRPQIQFHTVIVFFGKDLPTVGTISQGESFRLYSHHRGFQTNEGALESSQRMNFWTGGSLAKNATARMISYVCWRQVKVTFWKMIHLWTRPKIPFGTSVCVCLCVCVSMLVALTVRGSHVPFSGQNGVILKLAFILCKRLHEQIWCHVMWN